MKKKLIRSIFLIFIIIINIDVALCSSRNSIMQIKSTNLTCLLDSNLEHQGYEIKIFNNKPVLYFHGEPQRLALSPSYEPIKNKQLNILLHNTLPKSTILIEGKPFKRKTDKFGNAVLPTKFFDNTLILTLEINDNTNGKSLSLFFNLNTNLKIECSGTETFQCNIIEY